MPPRWARTIEMTIEEIYDESIRGVIRVGDGGASPATGTRIGWHRVCIKSIGDFPTLAKTGDSPCHAETSRNTPINKNARPSRSRRVTSRAVYRQRKPNGAPGRRSTKRPVAATSRAADETCPTLMYPARKVADWAVRPRRRLACTEVGFRQEGRRDSQEKQGGEGMNSSGSDRRMNRQKTATLSVARLIVGYAAVGHGAEPLPDRAVPAGQVNRHW